MEPVCIPRERYEYLIKCERLVDMEFEEKKGKNYFTDSGVMTMFTDNIISFHLLGKQQCRCHDKQ